MRENNDIQTRRKGSGARHPIRQQLLAAFLGLCLIVVSIPVSQFDFSVQAAELRARAVTMDDGDYQEREDEDGRRREKIKMGSLLEAEEILRFGGGEEITLTETPETPATPGCGVISEDVTWTDGGSLANGELVIMPGVTLTINGSITINGTVTIKGGGTIARGSTGAGFVMGEASSLTVEAVTMDGKAGTVGSSIPMITLNNRGNLVLESGCIIMNCQAGSDGGAICMRGGSLTLNDCIVKACGARQGGAIYTAGGIVTLNGAAIENCTASNYGGGIYATARYGTAVSLNLNNAAIRNCLAEMTSGGGLHVLDANVTINGGCYENNKATGTTTDISGFSGGGFIYMCGATLTINDGRFIGNSNAVKGGCIYHCGHAGTHTVIRGGVFLGNTCTNETFRGSGALHNSTADVGDTSVTLSGDVKFGDSADNSGTDGIYLDVKNLTERKVQISDTLTYPIKLYLRPREGYVMAQGVNQYQLLRERDMKKITFIDVTDSDKTWYAVLSDNNQIYTSETNPGYGYFVYYVKNGAKGEAPTDDTEYALDADVTAKSADGLTCEGRHFAGWNTQEDGEGTTYWPGDSFKIKGDTDLYAIFKTPITAGFYSGSAGNKEIVDTVMDWDAGRGTLTVPELEPMDGFEAVGWSSSPDGFEAELAPGEEITLRENAVYYGVYRKAVTLSYDANGGDSCPEGETKILRANVNEDEVSFDIPTFTIDGETAKKGAVFRGWSTKADGNDAEYQKDDTLRLENDTMLYAVFEAKRIFTADFYSGSAGNKASMIAELDDGSDSGVVTVPGLQPMDGFEAVGWSSRPDGFEAEDQIVPGEEITLTEDVVYYGVYRREVMLSYDANGGDGSPASEIKVLRANVNEDEVAYDLPVFTTAGPLPWTGYVFAGWNTERDGTGEPYLAGETMEAERDTTLYAMWIAGNYTPYRIEHYRQELEGDSYSRVDADTEYMAGKTGELVEAEANPYTGFSLSSDPELGKTAGIVEADGSLVLQLYYDRNIYDVDFDLNGGEGIPPKSQAVRYGGLLQETEEPQRTGYTFADWYKNQEGTETAYWNPYQTVEGNTDSLKNTLYAKWVDLTAPILGEASFGTGYRNLADWIVSQKKLTITVPVTEKGSGLKQGDYRLVSVDGKVKQGSAIIRTQQTVMPKFQARSSGLNAVMTIRGDAQSGDSIAEITIEEDFKGSVYLTCTDNAGNTSVEKVLTADGAGAIVEDNAPQIHFSKGRMELSKSRATVNVDVTDSAGKEITAGIAKITYQIDNGKVKAEGKEELADAMAESYSFSVEIKGEGKHTLTVTAVDNAGNESTKKASIEISKKKAVIVPKPQTPVKQTPTPGPAAGEPITGENTYVKIFATLGMVAGFTYLLLYFSSGENGITEKEKEEIVSRLIRWAQGGSFRKYPALILIWLFLIYYHSIGRSVSADWRSVCNG